jgi:putative ABC transport system permease protein
MLKMAKIKQIFKEILQSKLQIMIFIISLTLAVGTFISIDSLRLNVEDYIQKDSKILNGGDLIIDANREYSKNLSYALSVVKTNNPELEIVNSYTFSSVVYSPKQDDSLLSEIRIISNIYPLYGNAELASGKKISDVLIDSTVIVQEELLIRLNLEIGDELKIGDNIFNIVDVLLIEPDQPLSLFEFGPRVLVPEINLYDVNLIGDKSRVSYETFIKTSSEVQTIEILNYVEQFTEDRESIQTYEEKNNSLKRFVTNFLFFIKMISLFIIIITGIGITSIILSYLDDKKLSIGIRKSLGERNKDILVYYYKTIMLVSIFATMLSILFAYILMNIFPYLFSGVLPGEIGISLSLSAIIKGIAISLIITTLFTLYPLISLNNILPIQIFRHEVNNLFMKNKTFYFIYLLIIIFFTTFVFIEIEEFWFSIWLVVGSLSLFLILFILTTLTLSSIKQYKHKISNLELKQSINGLFRIGNKTILVITSVALSLSVIFTISFIEINLQNQFVSSFPENAPNFFVLDIPKENLTQIQDIIGEEITFYPMIRGSLLSIKNEDVQNVEDGAQRGGDSLTRTFSLTYGDLLDSEEIVDTLDDNNMFVTDWDSEFVQVSILEGISERMGVELGDIVVFLIQGIEIEAQIVSIRKRVSENIGAYFYFTFEEEVLENAPQTIFSIAKIESSQIPYIQNEIVKDFPQVTVINGEKTAKTVGEIIGQISSIVSFFTLFSLGAGILILLSSIISTNSQRTQEAVFYKLVGANKSFIRKVFMYEYLIIGLISSLIAIFISSLATFLITKYFLEIKFLFLTQEVIIYLFLTIFIIVVIGYLSSINVFVKKPIEYIRENRVE